MKSQVLSYTEFDNEFIQKKVVIIAELKKENEEPQRPGKPLHQIPEYISHTELSESVLKNKKIQLR